MTEKVKMTEEAKKKKWGKIAISTIGFIVWMMLTRLCAYSALHAENMRIVFGGAVLVTFFILPYLLLGALYGYLIALISFTVSFIITLIFDMDSAYKMSIFLVATICFSFLGQYGWFGSVKKTLLGALLTLCLISLMEMACFSVIDANEYTIQKAVDYKDYFFREAVVIILISMLLHLFFTKVPDICKLPFPIGVAYTKAFRENTEIQRSIRKTRVSVKITAIIIALEVILGIFVAVFMVALFPDIKDMFVASINNGEMFSGMEENIERTDVIRQFHNMRFHLTATAISYDIKMLLLMLCVGVPMAGFANFYTKTTIGDPLGNLSDFMHEYAEADDDKKLEVGRKVDRIPIKTHDEIQVVHDSMKATVEAVENYISHIKEEAELEKELEVAKQASEAKSSFLSNMSHEIRTPINAVLGLNEMIIRESSEPGIKEYASSVKSAGNSLLSIVNDILDFSKIEAGKMDILPVTYHLSSTINDLINMVSAKAKDKGLELLMNIDETLPSSLVGDEIRLKQCVTNILSNAVKYTEKGSVTLNVTWRKAKEDDNIFLKFQVIDTGIGIKEEDLDKLYSPFERIEEIRNRSIEGTGLGMSIVKKLLALMDTRLEVKSVYGEGSDFSFEVRQQVASWEPLGDFREKYRQFLASQKEYHESFTAPEALILVVDDTPINLTVVKGLLKKTLISIDTAESGFETLEMIKKKKYDIIFIDHRMPEMDGIETLERMKGMEDNLCVETPCIALTANAGAGAKDEYLKAGFSDYLSKPVDGALLENMIREYLPPQKVKEPLPQFGADKEEGKDEAPEDIDYNRQDELNLLQGIELSQGIKNCGSRDLLKEVVKEFLISIPSKADHIEGFAKEKDYRNYTVAVHALKSSARLIGALELSDMAAYLEQCGNEENETEIAEKTPELLLLYRSYTEKLSAIEEKKDDASLPMIPEEELKGALSDMRELLEAYDFDTADGIMQMLSEYSIPESYREKYERVRELMAAVDRDELLKILED